MVFPDIRVGVEIIGWMSGLPSLVGNVIEFSCSYHSCCFTSWSWYPRLLCFSCIWMRLNWDFQMWHLMSDRAIHWVWIFHFTTWKHWREQKSKLLTIFIEQIISFWRSEQHSFVFPLLTWKKVETWLHATRKYKSTEKSKKAQKISVFFEH